MSVSLRSTVSTLLTPQTPITTKNMTSKKCQSLSYATWNSTSFPVLKGFIADSVTVAERAQKNDLHMVDVV